MDYETLLKQSNAEVAAILGKSIPTICRLRKRLRLPAKSGRPRLLDDRKCKVCEKSFRPTNKKMKYCSLNCYHTAQVGRKCSNEMRERVRHAKLGKTRSCPWLLKTDTPAFTRYKNAVHRLSHKVYEAHKDVLNPNNLLRTRNGMGGVQLDHIKPVRECFDNGWTVEQAANLENLRMLPWRESVGRNKK